MNRARTIQRGVAPEGGLAGSRRLQRSLADAAARDLRVVVLAAVCCAVLFGVLLAGAVAGVVGLSLRGLAVGALFLAVLVGLAAARVAVRRGVD